jgi:hypothetical protein
MPRLEHEQPGHPAPPQSGELRAPGFTALSGARYGWRMAIFDVPKRFSQQWVERKVPQMDSTEFHAMFHEAATRGWDEDELRQLARMWADESGRAKST